MAQITIWANADNALHLIRRSLRIACERSLRSSAAALWCASILVSSIAHAAVTISTAATQNMSCSNSVCAPTAKKAVLNVTDLESLLAGGDTTVTTTGAGGVQANDIDERALLNWSSSSRLSLDAHCSITVTKSISVGGLAAVALTTNDGGNGGILSFGEKGSLSFTNPSSTLSVNGVSYSLVGTIAALASAIRANPSGDYALANDYDASGDGTYSNSPITTQFTGSFEGLGNTISHLSIYCSKCRDVGLFSEVDSGGEVASLKMTSLNLRVAGRKHSTALGGVTGTNGGVLFDVHVSGKISTKSSVSGGIAGGNGGSIISSTSNVRIKSLDVAGGLGPVDKLQPDFD